MMRPTQFPTISHATQHAIGFAGMSPSRFSIADVLSYPPESGAGSGGSSASGTPAGGSGSGGGAPNAGSGSGGSTGSGTGTPFSLNDDAVVDLGGGRTGRWGDLRESHYMPRERYDQGITYLNTVAAQLDQREQALVQRLTSAQQGRTPQGGQLPASDPFADLENMPIVDGKSLAALARKLSTDGFGSMAKTIADLSNKIKALEQTTGSVVQSTNHTAQRDAEIQFDNFVTDSLSKVTGIKGLPEGVAVDPKNPFLRELARDLYSSHEPESWKSAAEFHKQLGARVEQAIAFVRSLDKAAVTAGEERRRNFLNPRKGAVTPGQETRYQHMNGQGLARMLFQGAADAGRT